MAKLWFLSEQCNFVKNAVATLRIDIIIFKISNHVDIVTGPSNISRSNSLSPANGNPSEKKRKSSEIFGGTEALSKKLKTGDMKIIAEASRNNSAISKGKSVMLKNKPATPKERPATPKERPATAEERRAEETREEPVKLKKGLRTLDNLINEKSAKSETREFSSETTTPERRRSSENATSNEENIPTIGKFL